MQRVEAVIFDVDGTLVDTSEYISQAYEDTLARHGLPPRSRAEIASQVGKMLDACYAFLAPEGDIETLRMSHRTFQKENLHLVRPFEKCSEVLKEVSGNDRRLALFTSRINVLPSLEITGIDTELFEVVVDASMVEHGKPDPEGIYMILGELGLKACQAVVVGDAGVDIEAGKRAEVAATIGLTHGFGTRAELEEVEADYILDSLADLPQTIATIEQNI